MTEAEQIEVRDMRSDDTDEAVGVIARGMRDNPLHVAAYGEDPARRLFCHTHVAQGLFRIFTDQQPICAMRGETVVGIAGITPPGACRPSAPQRLRMAPAILRLGPRTARRMMLWLSAWEERDPDDPHTHLGPVAVDAHLQGQGIGSLLMREHCRRLDSRGEAGYLETDKQENVGFYERFGYEVVDEAPVIGVPNWFMRRGASEPRS